MIALVALLVLLAPPPLYGRDFGQYAQVDPGVREWFRSRTDRRGINCCDTSDGARLDDPEWECSDADTCQVRLDGRWTKVPTEAILTGRSAVGYAVVWRWYDLKGAHIRCFQPGSRA
jgi:hypothetical protein